MIEEIVVKYLDKNYSLVAIAEEKPYCQFLPKVKSIDGRIFNIDFVQVIGPKLYVIYQEK